MSNLDQISDELKALTIDEILSRLGNPETTQYDYVYLSIEGELVICDKPDRKSCPSDEYVSFGYVNSYERKITPHKGGRTESTSIRLTPNEKDLLDQAKELSGKSAADLLMGSVKRCLSWHSHPAVHGD